MWGETSPDDNASFSNIVHSKKSSFRVVLKLYLRVVKSPLSTLSTTFLSILFFKHMFSFSENGNLNYEHKLHLTLKT